MLDALVEEAVRDHGLDLAAGVQVVATERAISTPIEASRPLLLVPLAILAGARRASDNSSLEPVASDSVASERAAAELAATEPSASGATALPGRHGSAGRDPLALLQRLYPPDAPVARLRTGGAALTVAALTAADLESALYLRPVAPELAAAGPWAMPFISHRLRQPDGCPWDREQTHESLRKHLLEETYEVYDALEHGATPELAEELGDLWLQVVLHAQLAAEQGVFDLADVQASIARKIVRRHPHVFGDAVAKTAADVNRQWERIKAVERAEAAAASDGSAAPDGPRSALDGISVSMPALAASQEMQERAAALGYDWPDIDGVLDKVAEELDELARADGSSERREEFGDLLLVIVNVGRKLGIETEGALRAANEKFRGRFRRVERMVAERGVAIRDLDFEALDDLWDAAKVEEQAERAEAEVAR